MQSQDTSKLFYKCFIHWHWSLGNHLEDGKPKVWPLFMLFDNEEKLHRFIVFYGKYFSGHILIRDCFLCLLVCDKKLGSMVTGIL